jgi:hypothetical protein
LYCFKFLSVFHFFPFLSSSFSCTFATPYHLYFSLSILFRTCLIFIYLTELAETSPSHPTAPVRVRFRVAKCLIVQYLRQVRKRKTHTWKYIYLY